MGFSELLKNLPFMQPLSFQRYPDSFASTRAILYQRLMEVIRTQAQKGSTVFMTAHFPAEFFRMQSELNEDGIIYELITRPLDPQWFIDNQKRSEGVVHLALAEFLIDTGSVINESFKTRLDVIVVDRHPQPVHDLALEKFAQGFPAITRMGYFLALEDRVLNSVINDTTMQVLKQMGIDDQGLISSGIISKRITKVLAREEKLRVASGGGSADQSAESADAWYELND